MRKLLIVSLALGMLVVFSGVANAASSPPLVFISCAGKACGTIDFGLQIIDERQTTKGTVTQTFLAPKDRIFEGYLVANVTNPSDGIFEITELFFCGDVLNLSTGKNTPAQIDFTDFASVLSDIFFGKGDVDQSVFFEIIGTGSFSTPPGTTVGPDTLDASASGEYFGGTHTVSKIVVAGDAAGGFSDNELVPSTSSSIFRGRFSTTLVQAPTTIIPTSCTTGAACSAAGIVICAP